jgi:hypothetical protein
MRSALIARLTRLLDGRRASRNVGSSSVMGSILALTLDDRAILVQSMDTRNIRDLLHDEWRLGFAVVESDVQQAEILVTFDHDYTYHLLTIEWQRDAQGRFERSGWSLYYLGLYDSQPVTIPLASWDTTHSYADVLMSSASIVSEWRSLLAS